MPIEMQKKDPVGGETSATEMSPLNENKSFD